MLIIQIVQYKYMLQMIQDYLLIKATLYEVTILTYSNVKIKAVALCKTRCLLVWRNEKHVVVNQINALGCVFPSRLCHSGQTHRFRCCSVADKGAFEYPKPNSRNIVWVEMVSRILFVPKLIFLHFWDP